MTSVIVPTLNEEEHVIHLLASLGQQGSSDSEIIVIDGGSRDSTVRIARKNGARVVLLAGCGEFQSRNIAVNMARGQVLLFTSADVILSKDLLNKVQKRFEGDDNLVALSGPGIPCGAPVKGKFLYATYNLARYLYAKLPKRLRCFSTSTNFLAVRKEVFQKTGGFDPFDINADGLMGRKLLQMGEIDFSLDSFVFISARRMGKMGFLRFCSHYLYVLENFFPLLSRTRLIEHLKERSRSERR